MSRAAGCARSHPHHTELATCRWKEWGGGEACKEREDRGGRDGGEGGEGWRERREGGREGREGGEGGE